MSAASLASFLIDKLTSPEVRTSDAGDMTGRGQASPTPRLTTVWRAKSIPYDIPDTNQPFRSEGSLLRLLRTRSMPLLVREGTTAPGRQAALTRSHYSARSESLSPVRPATSRSANMQSSGHLSDASESTVASLATPPPTPRSPSPSGPRRNRSQSDGHLWQRRKRQMRKATDVSAIALPSVKNLRGKFENKPTSPEGNEQPAGQGQPDGEAAEEGLVVVPDRRWVSRHNSLLRPEPKSPERRQHPKPAVSAASVTKRLQQYEDSPQDVDEITEVFVTTDQQNLHGKSRSEASLKTTNSEASQDQEPRRRVGAPARMRPKNHRRSKSEPDPSSVLRFHAKSSPPSVKKLKMLFEREAFPDSSREPSPLSPRMTLREATPDPPQPHSISRKPAVADTDDPEVVLMGLAETTVPAKTPPVEQVDPVLVAGTPSVRSLRWRFETGASAQSLKSNENETTLRPSRAVVHNLKTPFEGPLPRQARSVSPEKERRGSTIRSSSASVKNLLRQFEALSPEEALQEAPVGQAVDERSGPSGLKDSLKKLEAPPPDHATTEAKKDAEDADRFAPKAEKDSTRRLWRQSRISSSSTSSDDDEKEDDKRLERELERKRKEEEEAKEKQRIEQEQREEKKRMEEKAEKERITKEKEKIAKEEMERKERERAEKEREARVQAELIREEQERLAKEEAQKKKTLQLLEEQRKENEERERKEREEKERKEREEKGRKEREDRERKEREDREWREREERERKERKEKERREREEKERKEREERERQEREERERKEKERERKERQKKEMEERERERQERDRKEKERMEREKAEEEKKNREKAEQERRAREEAERKKAQEEERQKQREREESQRLQKEKLEAEVRRQEEKRREEERRREGKRREEEKMREEERKRREELIRRLSSDEMPKKVEIVETRKKGKSESQSSDSDSDKDHKDAKDKVNERNMHEVISRSTYQGLCETSPPTDAASYEQSVERLIDQFTNLKDADLEGEAMRGKVSLGLAPDEEEKEEDRRSSDVASLVQKFRKMNARRRSSSSSSDNDGGRASPEKPKKETAPKPTIPTRTNVPGKVRTLRADELRFFEASSGDGGTEAFTRTQSLRGKKSEPFTKPRFGSLRGNKSRVAVLSTSSTTNAALPKNCRHLNTDELRFFTGEVTNIYRSRATNGRGGKTTRGEGRLPAVPQDNTLPDTEEFFRLAGRGGPASEANGRPAPSEDDSDSEPSILRSGEDLTDSEGDIYEMDITLRSENDTDDASDTEQHDLDHPLSLLVHSIQGKLLHPVDPSGGMKEDTRCYVVFSPGGYITSSDDEDDVTTPKFPLTSPILTENVLTTTLTENRYPNVVVLDEVTRPAAPGQGVLPDASTRHGTGKDALKHTKFEHNTAKHFQSADTKTDQILKTSLQTTVISTTENEVIDHGETQVAARLLVDIDDLVLKKPIPGTQTEDNWNSRPLLKDELTVVVKKEDVSLAQEAVIVKLETKIEQQEEIVEVVKKKEVDILKMGNEKLEEGKREKMVEMKYKKHEKEGDEKTTDKMQEKIKIGKEKDEKEQVQDEALVMKNEASILKTRQHRPLVDPDEKVDEDALATFLGELDKLNSLPRTIKPPPPCENRKSRMNDDDSSSDDSSSDYEELSAEDQRNIEEQIIPLASFQGFSASSGSLSGTLKTQKDSMSPLKDSSTLHGSTENLVSVTDKNYGIEMKMDKEKEDEKGVTVKEAVDVAKNKAIPETRQHRPLVDPDEEVDEDALGAFMDELDKLNSLSRTFKPPPPRENPKTRMNDDDSSNEYEGLSTEGLNNIEEQIIPLASFQGLSASPRSPSGTLEDQKDSRILLKDSNTLHGTTENLVSVASFSQSEKEKEKNEGYHASPPLLEHSMRQEEEEKTVKEKIQQTYTSPLLPESLERKETEEKGIGRETTDQRRETRVREENPVTSPHEENSDIISGKEFIQFCIFSIWFSVVMYCFRDLLS